ncbi:23S rRNA (cytidine1920-2'-O)/16S rRNA (cytidine1409-2'-O)-methyltransferase [Phenylobacterium haematophilum]|uniref:23S rRNA (Cytidine1920-2'-O)/16S rRNA (Cytidine1409-2'-O)-methyltransferase n=1 Tax=Phenylobacterium haematophilum TaxID=98513 RepID=A0A839ZWL1_9CAUL|nr:TlyA family RNA methyltransferase [Phenylobacterium haematophilum]MBB3889680.1 23S rRNA (cytidine1920-2'-O)/16S rRNA (cytidine1409-2'-O)-methyltransferase [Phenylobacterium haematophilum]
MGKKRADVVLVERGLFDSRAKARAAIEAGGVSVAGRVLSKPSELIEADADIAAVAAHPYVGRGALKLVHALDLWPVQVQGRTVVDVGASTGGFTEVCLLRGAARVYAVDVGRGQLHAKLAGDPRVVGLEGVDARTLDPQLIPVAPDLIVTDVSFIGLAKALPAALALAAGGADLVALVKPQFEVGPEHVGKGGLVKDEAARRRALDEVAAFLSASRWAVREVADSPIAGGDGNLEYLLWAQRA